MPYIGVSPQFGVRRKHTYTATAGQTIFTGAGAEGATLSYKDSNFVDVYQNGVKLGDADYTATSGTAIVLGTGASVSDLVVVVVYDVFSAADTVSKADGGTFDGNIVMAGTLGVTGNQTNSGNLTVSGAFTSQGIDDNADATAITINSSETVMIGRTSTGYSNTGAQFTASGAQNIFVADGDYPLGLNRQNDSGIILDIRHDGTTVGSIQERFNNIQIGTGETNLLFNNGSNEISPSSSSGGTRDNTTDLGANNRRWKDFYVGSSIRIGGTGTANALSDYEEGTWTPAFDDAGGGTFGYSSQSGTYTKIGRLVYCQFSIVVSSVSSLSGSIMRITGQPFSSNSDENMVVTRYQGFTSGAPHRGNASGSSSVNIKSEGTNDNGNFPSSNTTSSSQLIGQIMFTTP